MKSIIPDPAQLDELAAGLDAGWDEEPARASTSHPPLSPSQAPQSQPPSLDALDADWGDSDEPGVSPAERAAGQPSRGPAPLRVSKRERREIERQRRAHQAQQNSASKKQRKAERLAAARQASELQRAAEQKALAERQQRQPKPARKRPKPSETTSTKGVVEGAAGAATAKRVAKRTRREPAPAPRPVTPAQKAPITKSEPKPVVTERGFQKLIVPLLIALLVAVTLGFALSRAR